MQAQRDALQQQQDLLQQLEHLQNGRQPPPNQAAAAGTQQAALSWRGPAANASSYGAVGAAASATSAAAGVGDAVKFSQALTAAEADRRAALKQAAAAHGESQQLRQQLHQQEQELHHLRRYVGNCTRLLIEQPQRARLLVFQQEDAGKSWACGMPVNAHMLLSCI